MPVPSTMMGLSETMVLTLKGRVTSEQTRIMMPAPMAVTILISSLRCSSRRWSGWETRPFSPWEPSSVVM